MAHENNTDDVQSNVTSQESVPQEPDISSQDEQRIRQDEIRRLREQRTKREKPKRKPRPILRYYNTDLLIPVNRTQIVPGNYYVFQYNNYKHVPTPIVFYIGTNPQYNTMEGISMQYLGLAERKRVEGYVQSLGLHSERAAKNGIKIKNDDGEFRHLYRNSYSSDSIYQFLRRKMKNKIYFYRRYKFNHMIGRVYAVPIEAIDRALEIVTPMRPFTNRENQKIKESKNVFNRVLGNYGRK